MMDPGKYDQLATAVREAAKAKAVIVIVFGGELGSGFAVQAEEGVNLDLPGILRWMAREIEKDLESHSQN